MYNHNDNASGSSGAKRTPVRQRAHDANTRFRRRFPRGSVAAGGWPRLADA